MSAVAATAIVVAVIVAGREVARLDRAAADERLTRVVERLELLAAQSAQQRDELKRRVAADPAVVAVLSADDVDDDSLNAALSRLRAPADSGLPVQVVNRNGSVVYSDIVEPLPAERAPTRQLPLDTVPTYGAFRIDHRGTLYHSTAPVLLNGEIIGWVVQLRRIGNPAAAAQLEDLIGSDARILFHYPGDSLWITMAGDPVPAPLTQPPWDSTVAVSTTAGAQFVRARQVRGAPWTVLVEMPAGVVASGSSFMQRMLAIGVILIFLTVVVALVLSRTLTRGLRKLSDASAGLAKGDFTARVPELSGGEEMDRLAAAFNVMAAQVAESHNALEARLHEARALTDELSVANVEAEQARLRAEAADRAKSEFLATMSHEIRTPINAVLGFCQVLELDGLPEEKRREYLERTQRAARQLASLVEDVLDLSKIQSQSVAINNAPTLLRPVIESAAGIVSEEVRRRRIDLQLDAAPDVVVLADPTRLQQVLLNLLSNAVKFTPEGGRIRLSTVLEGANGAVPRVGIVVEDNGIGIAPEQIERIFEPFVQGHSGYTREYGGTGLGLSISRRLARLMDGDIVAESTPGVGSRFTLRLPTATAVPAG